MSHPAKHHLKYTFAITANEQLIAHMLKTKIPAKMKLSIQRNCHASMTAFTGCKVMH